MPFLLADCISRSFGELRVLSSATLRAEPHQVRVIFGRNGAGKSTLIKIAAGMLAPDAGMVHLDGAPVLNPTLASLARRGVFYLPDHDLLSGAFTVGAQLDFFERRFGAGSAAEAARLTGVDHLLHRRPYSLSGGELRRAELAVVLTRRPRCLLADESYRGITPADHDGLTAIFRSIAEAGCAVVLTGHEVPSLLDAADHITWCTAGTTYELGPPDAARRHEAFCREYLGPQALTGRVVDSRAVLRP